MLGELCKELNNWFAAAIYLGEYDITGGILTGLEDDLKAGQYFRIVGSVFNDGVYQYPAVDLVDEKFDGAVWAMAVPKEVLALSNKIDEWKEKYATVDSQALSPYQSESFGGYSYSKGSGGTEDGKTGKWQGVFASELNRWRKLR